MGKIKVHPTFWVYAIILLLQNNYILLLANAVCILMHEWAHAKVAYNLGYYLDTLNIMPYGGMLSGDSDFSDKDGLKIAFVGPLINFFICVCLLALWWISPNAYSYTKPFYQASLTLALFNLIPIFPLDGARIIISISNNKQRTISIIKVIGIVISGLLALLFVASFFYKPNLSIGIISATIYIASINNTESETYKLITNNYSYQKSLNHPINKQTIMIHYNLKLIRLLKHLKPDAEVIFEVVDDDLNVIKTFNVMEIRKFLGKENLQTKIKELLYL